MTVNTMKAAWAEADRIFPTDYNKDEAKSISAGYDVYVSTISNAWISDLGNRLEVNFEDGTTVNIWIEEVRENVSITVDGVRKIEGLTLIKALKMVKNAGFMVMTGFDFTNDIEAIIANAESIHENAVKYAPDSESWKYSLDHEYDHFLLTFPDGNMLIATHFSTFDMAVYGTYETEKDTQAAFEVWKCGIMAEECADSREDRKTDTWKERYLLSKILLAAERKRLSKEFAEKYGA